MNKKNDNQNPGYRPQDLLKGTKDTQNFEHPFQHYDQDDQQKDFRRDQAKNAGEQTDAGKAYGGHREGISPQDRGMDTNGNSEGRFNERERGPKNPGRSAEH